MPPDKGCRQTRAEIVRRRSWGGVLPLGRHVSISGSSFIQCASASIAPPHPGGPKCYPGAEVQGRTGSRIQPTVIMEHLSPLTNDGRRVYTGLFNAMFERSGADGAMKDVFPLSERSPV